MADISSLADAVRDLIHDGDSVAMEGFTHLIPFAAGHEVIRQRKRDLTIIRMTPDVIYDQLIGSGCAKRLIFSWGGNPGVGSLHRLRDAVEKDWPQPLEIREHSHADLANAYVAGASNLPFAVLRGYAGCELPKHNPWVRTIQCPFTGETTIERFGRIDVLINVVGGTIWMKPYQHYSEPEIEAEIRRSLFPTLWCCRAVLPYMICRGEGVIVDVSSVATRGINRVPYSAAKGGVNAITASLAMEWGPHGIRVATAPGGTTAPQRRVPRNPAGKTADEEGWSQQVVEQTTQSSLMKRFGDLTDQAAAILFLASEDAAYITGTTLPVAGGDQG
jgi:dihydroxycyclohexadiene carboxylate dehydrogenase